MLPLSSATSQFPVELWENILKIALRSFISLSSNPVQLKGRDDLAIKRWHNLSSRREIEEQWRILRLVCRSWCIFVAKFRHQYVLYGNVLTGAIDIQSLKRAIRIQITPLRLSCGCQMTCRCAQYGYVPYQPEATVDAMMRSWSTNLNSTEKLNATIISATCPLDLEQLLSVAHKLPNLRALSLKGTTTRCNLADISEKFPKLSYLSLYIPSSFPIEPSLSLHHLTTLELGEFMLHRAEFGSWDLPSLRCLTLQSLHPDDVDDLLLGLTRFGGRLHTFQIGYVVYQITIPSTFWELLPVIEVVGADLAIIKFETPPPSLHPLHTVRNTGIFSDSLRALMVIKSSWKGIRVLSSPHPWPLDLDPESDGLFSLFNPETSIEIGTKTPNSLKWPGMPSKMEAGKLELLVDVILCERSHIRFEDSTGRTMREAILGVSTH